MPYKDPIRARQNKKEYYRKNKQYILNRESEYYRKHKTELSIRRRKYDIAKTFRVFWSSLEPKITYQTDRDKKKQYAKEYAKKTNYRSQKDHYWRNRKVRLDYTRQYYQLNREKILERCKEYQMQNKDKIRERQAKYYKKHGYGGCSHHSIEERISMTLRKKLDNATCQWQKCSRNHSNSIIDVHHIFPRNEYPELKERIEYMICYCREHHILWHEARGDIHVVNFLKGALKKHTAEIIKPLVDSDMIINHIFRSPIINNSLT